MVKKVIIDPEEIRRRREAFHALQSAPIPPASEQQQADIDKRLNQVNRDNHDIKPRKPAAPKKTTPATSETATPVVVRPRGRPRVTPPEAKTIALRASPEFRQMIKKGKESANQAGLRLIRLALDLIDAAGGAEPASTGVEMIRAIKQAADKNAAAQIARDYYKEKL